MGRFELQFTNKLMSRRGCADANVGVDIEKVA